MMPAVNSVSELNKQKLRLFVEAVWNQGRLELVDELVAADYIGRVGCAPTGILGPRGVRRLVSSRRVAHPGLYVRIEDQIAEEDRVAIRWQAMMARPGAGAAGAPGGAVRCLEGISVVRLIAGMQVDSHTQYTNLLSVTPVDCDGLGPGPQASALASRPSNR